MQNGSMIGTFEYKKAGVWLTVGSLFYFRSGHAKIRMKSLPLWAMYNAKWFRAKFNPCPKVINAPLVEGDIIARLDKEDIYLGKVISDQDDGIGNTIYRMLLHSIDMGSLCRVIELQQAENEKKDRGLWLTVKIS